MTDCKMASKEANNKHKRKLEIISNIWLEIEKEKKDYKRVKSELNIIKEQHTAILIDYGTYKIESMKMDHKQRDKINELKKQLLENNGKIRNETIREILDEIEECGVCDSLCIPDHIYFKLAKESEYPD